LFANAAPPGGAAVAVPPGGALPAAGGAARAGLGLPVAIAAGSVWLIQIAVYVVLFRLSGFSLAMSTRGAFANGLPDGLLALAVAHACRKLDERRTDGSQLVVAHLSRGFLLVAFSFLAKTGLLWLDNQFVRGREMQVVPGVIAWQIFVSTLTYCAIAAGSHAWLIDRRLRREEARAASAEALRARAELSALRAQLNPHFLFNVLHSVLGMMRRDPALAEQALERLGDLLRYALRVHRDGVDRTALRHEWEFMETYLELETIRLGDRLKISKRVDEAALDCSVPTFSVQPLVENAVRHGIAPRAEGGSVRVDASLVAGLLRIEVTNDGAGEATAANGDESGTGLRVLRERLEVLYHGHAELSCGAAGEGSYRAVLTLPATSEAAEADA